MRPDLLARLQQADAALARQDWQGAEALFCGVYREAEDDANIHAGLAFAAYKQGKIEPAARHFADACLRRQEPQWVTFLVDAYARVGATLAAWQLLELCRRRHPTKFSILQSSGAAERVEKALSSLAEGVGIDWVPGSCVRAAIPAKSAAEELARLLHSGRNAQAIKLGESLRRKHPACTDLLANLALAYKRCGRFEDSYRENLRAFLISTTQQSVCGNLGNLLIEQGDILQAQRLLEASAIALPEAGFIWGNLAAAYNHHGGLPVEAEFASRRALDLNCSASANTHRGLAAALLRQGRVREAMREYKEGHDPKDDASRTAPLLAMIMADDFDADAVARAHQEYGRDLERRLGVVDVMARGAWREPLTVGFVTADFRSHSVSYFALPLVEQLAARGVRLITYFNFGREDAVSQAYKRHMAGWVSVRGMPDEELLERIRADRVDVLLDLSGHTSGHRLPVFMRRPAPLQMTWLGHPATTGLCTVDARVTDWHADPLGVDHLYTERLIRLEGTFAVYRPLVRSPEMLGSEHYAVRTPPVLGNGHITFGSCNTLAKYSDTTIRAWARVLRAVPGSRLLIESPGLHTVALQRLVVQRFLENGVGPERLDLRDRDRSRQYVIYNDIDISLDSYPCNGGTTTFDLLWMGVPLVTLKGDSFAGRMGASLLNGLGRPEWVAGNEDRFVEIAADMASDAGRLAQWRGEQRERMQASALMDEPGFAQRFLAGIQQAWNLPQ